MSGGARPRFVASPVDTGLTPARIINAANAVVLGTEVDGQGNLLTVWNRGYRYDRPTALAIQGVDGSHVAELGPPDAGGVVALSSGWVVKGAGAGGLVRVDSAGTITTITRPDREATGGHPGDVVIPGRHAAYWLYRPSTNTTYSLDTVLSRVLRASPVTITADGTLVALVNRSGVARVAQLRDGHWTSVALDPESGPSPGDLVSVGDVLVADTTYHPAPLGDGSGVEDPVHLIGVSLDGGRHWRTSRAPRDEHIVLSLTATSDGTVFGTVAQPSKPGCSLLRMTPEGPVTCGSVTDAVQVFAHDDRVYAITIGPHHHYALLTSDDNGVTWQPSLVPGK